MKDILKILDAAYLDRPVMDLVNTDPTLVFLRMLMEIEEAQEELNAYMRGESSPEKVAQEYADVMVLLLACFRSLKQDPETHTKDKIGKLVLKYPPRLFSNGRTYTQACAVANENWKQGSKDYGPS